jgi:hypothetical protein
VHDDNGYQIDEAEVAYWGRCPDCQRRSTSTWSARQKIRSRTRIRDRGRGTGDRRRKTPRTK